MKKNKSIEEIQRDLWLNDKVTVASNVPASSKLGEYAKEILDKNDGLEWLNSKSQNDMKWVRDTEISENSELGVRLKAFCKQNKTNPDDLFSWLMG